MKGTKLPENIIPFVIPSVHPTDEEQQEDTRMFPGGFWKCWKQYRKENPPKWHSYELPVVGRIAKRVALVCFGLLIVVNIFKAIYG